MIGIPKHFSYKIFGSKGSLHNLGFLIYIKMKLEKFENCAKVHLFCG